MNHTLKQRLRANQPAVICAAITIICGCACIMHWHRWTALDIPIAARTDVSAKFKSDLRGTYVAQIDMRRSDNVENDMSVILPKMTLQVMDESGLRVDTAEPGGYVGQTVGKTVTKFKAEPGKYYYVHWQQTENDAAFRKRAPRLQVIVSQSRMTSSVIQCSFLGMLAVASGVFALVLFFRELESAKYKVA